MRFSVGDKVLASRHETGEDHEPGVVIDSYELIIGNDKRPAIVVEFEDGERKYMTAATPNVLPVEPEEEEAAGEEAIDIEDAADEPAAVADAEQSTGRAAPFDDDELGAP